MSSKCPMCESPCIIKIIATEDERYREVDVCQSCGTMYPREKAKAAPRKRRASSKPSKKKPRKK